MAFAFLAVSAHAGDRSIIMSVNPEPALLGSTVRFICTGTGDWEHDRITSGKMTLWNASSVRLLSGVSMKVTELTATYDYTIKSTESVGTWRFECTIGDGDHTAVRQDTFLVAAAGGGGGSGGTSPITAHQSITSYNGPATCIACHKTAGTDMLNSLHMKWSGPTPEVTNGGGATLGKAIKGINTFCTYAMSSKGTCFACHVRSDGNAPHAPTVNDVDCLMCHNDTYQRKFVVDPNSSVTVTNVLGIVKTYSFGLVEPDGDYVTEPDFTVMPPDVTMVDIAKNVHKPTRKSCLRCHAKAGGSDWAKRGDMGLNSVTPTRDQDVHMSPDGANLSCTKCHTTASHKIGGRGIDLRQTEAADPTCQSCHTAAPHRSSATMNRHAAGQVACQVCHILTFGKGGATEMSRDWKSPVWSPPFCNAQGGFVGHEVKTSNVKPEYVWFDGTSYVYNIGEVIMPNAQGIYNMAKANGRAFDGTSKIVPIKRHFTDTALHESGKIVPPMIMWMFMTGDFDLAVQKGMEEQNMTGRYTMVTADAEMLITHGVDPKTKAPTCTACHNTYGTTPDGTKMIPFDKLGYHVWPAKVRACTLCHSSETMSWESMHEKHRSKIRSCKNCHTTEPIGLVKPQSDLCNDCHSMKSWSGASTHKKHVEKYDCTKCHKF
ncbi:MAG: hypothetical protein A2X56_12430 [Nitrospirae bacterium GWC2_57_13]|nr:MAG: hypothetical protein A2X56_12430 [Nitrospirae bacterium GWC2_57_13]